MEKSGAGRKNMKRVTVKDIANHLNLSLGTINKALNNKQGINEETRKKVMDAARQMGYRVNKVAQSMARNTFRIGIVIPTIWEEHYKVIRMGIEQELDILSDYNVEGIYYDVGSIHVNEEWFAALGKCAEEVQAVIICPPQNNVIEKAINELVQKGIFVLALESDIKRSKRQTCVQANHLCVGELAAEMADYILKKGQTAAVFVGNKDMTNHSDKATAFCAAAKEYGFEVAGVFETHDDPAVAKRLTEKLIRENEEIGVIFSTTGNYEAVCEYIEENKLSDVYVIGMDIYPFTKRYFENGIVRCVIYQAREEQGRKAVRLVYDACMEQKEAPDIALVLPQIVLKSNFAYFEG